MQANNLFEVLYKFYKQLSDTEMSEMCVAKWTQMSLLTNIKNDYDAAFEEQINFPDFKYFA